MMAEGDRILSQQEVDALLSAIDSGEVEVVAEAAAAPRPVPYDFKRPERVSGDQMRALEALHERYARSLQAALTGMLRAGVEVRVAGVDQLTYLEFVGSLPNPTAFAVLSAEPLAGKFILEINPAIAFPFLERLLGSGQLSRSQPERSLTRIEWKLLEGVLGRALDLLGELWAPILPVTFRLTACEANPRLMQVLSANELVVSVALEVSLGGQKGTMNLCMPVVAIEGYLGEITSHVRLSSGREAGRHGGEGAISRRLAPAELRVSAHLPEVEVRLGDLEALRPGDLVRTGRPAAGPILVSLEGCPKFRALLGRLKERRAFRVEGRAEEEGAARGEITIRRGEGAAVGGGGAGPAMREVLLGVPLEVAVVLAERVLPIREVLGMGPGRVLEFGRRADAPLQLRVGARVVGEGLPVKVGERFGLQLTSLWTSSPPGF